LVAVVAHFANRGLHHAVTASCGRIAWFAGLRANPAALELATAAAAIAAIAVAVVAVLARFDTLVTALRYANARLSWRRALEGRVLNRAGGIAAITVGGVAVVAHLARANDAITTNDILRACAGRGTAPIVFDLAGPIAAITGHRVSVVAFLGWLIDTVAAARRGLSLAPLGAGAVAKPRVAIRAAARGGSIVGIDNNSAGSGSARLRTTRASFSATSSASLDSRIGAGNRRKRKNRRDTGPCQMGYKWTNKH